MTTHSLLKGPLTRARSSAARRRAAVTGGGYHLVSGLLSFLFILPILWAILNSLKTPQEANQSPPTWFPHSLSLQNYEKLANYGDGLGVYLWNSISLSVIVVIGTVVIAVLAGYGFARFTFFGKNLLFGTTLLVLMVPYATILVPLYIVLGWIGLTNTVFGLALILIMFQLPFGVFLMRNSFESIPKELEEAALVDGCGPVGALRYISLRLVLPGVVTVALFSFLSSWNEFLAPLIFLNDGSQYTLPVMLVNLSTGQYGAVDYGALQAGVVVSIVPVLLLYLFLQRFYISGLVNGASVDDAALTHRDHTAARPTSQGTSMPDRRLIAPVDPRESSHLTYLPLGLEAANITSGYWATWQEDNRTITTPHSFAWLERDHTIDNLRRLAPGSTVTEEREGLWFTDSDLYKAMEALAWEVGRTDDPRLTELLADMTAIVGAAQADDGYINSFIQAGLGTRWDNLVMSHELYCIGHLIQAGVAHKRSTGREELLGIAIKAADLVVRDFGDLRRGDTDGHEEIEMALVELYRETGNDTYLAMAQQFIDVRGHGVLPPNDHAESPYYQDATPVREETTVVGHAVRAIYLLAGVVDVYLETGEQALLAAAERQWRAMTATKTYLTGAVGSRFVGEAFGEAYELPPDLAYGETCATIGNIMVSWRLLLATGESRYGDAIERALFNLFSASTSLDRVGFFYNNPAQRRRALPAAPTDTRPARADAPGTRPAWYECACCPPNIMRTIASLASYLSTHTANSIQVHQFINSRIEVDLGTGHVELEISTQYPLDGVVTVTVLETPDNEWSLEIRLPDWAREATIAIAGETPVEAVANPLGYVSIERAWEDGDRVEFVLPMKPRLTVAHPSVDAVRGSVAIERGPIVYAFESVDQEDGVDLNHVELLASALIAEKRETHRGTEVVTLEVNGLIRDDSAWAGSGWMTASEVSPVAGRSVRLTAIPYFAWANRGPSVMRIFVPISSSIED